jgi:hypothetical protein
LRGKLVETMPGGIAVLRLRGDGRPDIFFTDGAVIPSLEKSAPHLITDCFGMREYEFPMPAPKRVSLAAATPWEPPPRTSTTMEMLILSLQGCGVNARNFTCIVIRVYAPRWNQLFRSKGDGAFDVVWEPQELRLTRVSRWASEWPITVATGVWTFSLPMTAGRTS